ncbi:MAG TPA: GNAT family N-acetyltransferase [Chitinophagaceae bacterium]|nr:GNAT family N-acetyltransferase [Chitinophagaceae bacterium]HNU13619.1 GNAT family N-acetyltransferase [Chitinophagaceae bacterium]
MDKNRIREAKVNDIPQIQRVRNAVEENQLSDPSLVTDSDVADYITRRGKGWVYVENMEIVAFAIVSVADRNVWALFVEPGYDKKGIGRQLHDRMMDWYFGQTADVIWLSTTPGTRAESFYRKSGWQETGLYGKGEIRFEMTLEGWKNRERATKS